ncbi:uncharacterized protein LOC131445864 [Solea solea]|uniref:uncharacterized protein LOC131445863 n=1 Tax=Solea solea TaxID=90069 RepID=UPI00272A764E|nr:uncharacterized protein LOC131445863 [Solea solea]XP_058472556.1 uncharacterized protein LOC131445864 [Solea solea]
MSGPSPVTIEDCPPLHSSPDLIQSKVAANVDTLPVTFDAGSVSSGEEEIIVVSDTDSEGSISFGWTDTLPLAQGSGSVGACVDEVTVISDTDSEGSISFGCFDTVPRSFGVRSVRGSFHQGDQRFKYRGVQCMAVSLAAMAMHKTKSVFSWQTRHLDKAVVCGDKIYTSLRDNNLICGGHTIPCIPELPKQLDKDGHSYDFEYGDFVTGDVNVVEGEFIDAGVCTTLKDGLEKMCMEYDTCFFTLLSRTCGIIREGERFAVVDSHARSADGMVHPNGKSVVVYFSSLEHLIQHVSCFAAGFRGTQKLFEIAGVRVTVKVDGGGSQSSSGKIGAKRKATKMPTRTSKRFKRSDPVDSDVAFVSEVTVKELVFNPVRNDVARTLCDKLHVESEKVDDLFSIVGVLGAPCKKDTIVGDGNCFFRSVSQAVCGSQKNHRKIRLAVVKQLEDNAVAYESILRSEFSSVSDYVSKSRMRYVGSWATEVEIQAAADCLGVSIFTYIGDRWLEYSCKNRQFSSQAVYLDNINGNHYETVVCVHQPQSQFCYGYCKVGEATTGYNLRQHCDVEVETTATNTNYCFSKYLKKKVFYQNTIKYKENVLQKLKRQERSKRRYHEDAMVRYKCNQSSVQKYKQNVRHREMVKADSKIKYKQDVRHREVVKTGSKIKYKQDVRHREVVKTGSKIKYKQDVRHREVVKTGSKIKYKQDVRHREVVKTGSKIKYKQDVRHREMVKAFSIKKYKQDIHHREMVKTVSKMKYKQDVEYRESLKAKSKVQYTSDLTHRQKKKELSKKKYHSDPEIQLRVKAVNKVKRQQLKNKPADFDFVIQQFLCKVKDGPDFVCCVCQRLLFQYQVLSCKRSNYNNSDDMALIADKCISDKYLHTCNEICVSPCQLLQSPRGQLWICRTCHSKINNKQIPPECVVNNLDVHDVPPELACLNSLEQHLIALHIPFMKVLALPKGGQNGVHGPVTCVPANIVETNNLLPRSNMEGSLLRVKLKRKLTYKGHYEYQYVDTMRIRQALSYLKQNNMYYKDVDFNEDWLNDFCREQENESVVQDSDVCVGKDETPAKVDEGEDELLHDRQQHCMFQDTCLMPVDIGQETLDQYYEGVFNVAPAEGNSPVKLLSNRENEAKCFPVLFPQGHSVFHDNREHRLTLSRYFNNRILHADGRFAQNVEYIFFAQYMSELEQVVSNVSIALRKGKGSHVPKRVRDVVNNEESLRKLLEFDDGYRFLKPIRGTPSFWQAAQRDLLACVRQLGVPTWFCSFSAADMRWTNLLGSILKQEGREQTAEELQWADKCELLRRNPVTAARMFDFRWHCFLREVLMSPSNPIGKIKDYFYRVEFQQRGSPHVHCLFWIENAPLIDQNSDEEVVEFIDQYVTSELPSDDDTLLDIVSSVQVHSKRHSKTCKKKNTVCRFNFPRPASAQTFISRVKVDEEIEKCNCEKTDSTETVCLKCKERDFEERKARKVRAHEILAKIKEALSDENQSFDTVEQLFETLNVTQEAFEDAFNRTTTGTKVVLKRQVKEAWVNQYNKQLLKCWNANLDIQYVVDAYACVVYIISYISKAEKEMGLLLSNAQREAAKDGNVSAKEALKKLGGVYLHNRDVCAQEAVYRLTNMHLKECSRKVMFVPTGENVVKMSLPLNVLKQRAATNDINTEEMWMTSLVDRYKNRPNDSIFNDMCIATFASEYRVLSKNENCKTKIALSNNCGFVTKRVRTEPAVVRYARFSVTKNPELFHLSRLQLFMPYRVDEQLKPEGFETFQQFYNNGNVVLCDGSVHQVKTVVDDNRSRFEVDADMLDDIQNRINLDGVEEDAWCQLCPEQELERLEAVEEMAERQEAEVDQQEHIPDLAVNREQVQHLEKMNNVMCRSDGLSLVRSLNDTQMRVFYQTRQWCLDKCSGKNPPPLHVFITGGAGTGKSHLIKAIQYESMRLLSPLCSNPDNVSVLITAPTGIAAYNLNAATIHHTFSIGVDVRLPYSPLGEEKINSLRAKFTDLQILIIDEISMVNANLLAYIHGRLRQMKQSGNLPFGNICVIAVGDFYQLPPVRGKPLYVEDLNIDLWSLFSVVHLTEVIRQKDSAFAELLNRVRIHSKGTPMLRSDVDTLKHCETGEVSSALHIYATNQQVNAHNIQRLYDVCRDYVTIEAQDFQNNRRTGKLELIQGHHAKAKNTYLAEQLLLGEGARVMLCQNVDVSDGLVNGACGVVTRIVKSERVQFPIKVYVKFDDENVGAERRRQSPSVSADVAGSTAIAPEEERACKKGGLRRQYPLKLAWACTIHKVQGITVNNIVVCFDKIFAAGQAYVALSRVRSLSGLIIEQFDEKKIYCRGDIKDAIQTMSPFLVDSLLGQQLRASRFGVFLMNVQGLTRHVPDLVLCTQQLQLNCIAVTETWLAADFSMESINIEGYRFYGCSRSSSYSSDDPRLVTLKDQLHGGVGIYIAPNTEFEIQEVPPFNLECIVSKFTSHNLVIAVIYRPPCYPMTLFKTNLGNFLDWLDSVNGTIAVMGDFNDDILKLSATCPLLTAKGYMQIVTKATTEKGTLIDHIYVKRADNGAESLVLPTYFSDHEAVLCLLK